MKHHGVNKVADSGDCLHESVSFIDRNLSREGRTVSMLAPYMELAVHLRSNSNCSVSLVSFSRSVEQNDGALVPVFCGRLSNRGTLDSSLYETHHTGFEKLIRFIDKFFYLCLPLNCITLKSRSREPQGNVF